MSTKDSVFCRRLWRRLLEEELTDERLAERLRADGGHDIANLSDADLIDLMNGRYHGSWSEVAFSFSELLAYYSVPGTIASSQQVVGWVFTALMIAAAIERDEADWEMEFDKFIDGFIAVRARLESDEAVDIFERVFGRRGGS